MTTTETQPAPPVPKGLMIRPPADIAALIHRLAYETGRSKQDLIVDAIRQTYQK